MNFIEGAEAAKHNAHTIGVRPEHITVGQGPWEGVVGLSEHLKPTASARSTWTASA
jgi:multiple sugar transport system ATP-binding protein